MSDPLSPKILTDQGSCCGSGCTNCPYIPRHNKGNTVIDRHFMEFSGKNPSVVFNFQVYEKLKK